MAHAVCKVGCCGFTRRRAELLASFRVVEVQKTFYQPPRPSTADRWREEAGEAVEYTLKAWQLITHEPSSPTYRRLTGELSDAQKRQAGAFRWTSVVRSAWDRTADIARRLRATKVVFQCPRSLRPTDKVKDNLRMFFGGIDRQGLTCIWEPRGWPHEEVKPLCRELDLVHCVDPFADRAVTGGLRYWRLHGIGGYRHEYTDRELQDLADRRPRTRPTYALFNNMTMFEDATRFQALVGAS